MTLSLWTVYDNPTDYPGKFVARRYTLDKPTSDVVIAESLPALRKLLPPGLHRLARHPDDDAKIVETWL